MVLFGRYLVEDGRNLYVAVGIFGLGFGKRHRKNRKIRSYRFYCIERVESMKVMVFGIRFSAQTWTATNTIVDITDETFKTPGEARRLLMENGKKRRVVFRVEHNLLPVEEERLLRRLEGLRQC